MRRIRVYPIIWNSKYNKSNGRIKKRNRNVLGNVTAFPFLMQERNIMTAEQIKRLNTLIENDNADAFYSWKPWKRLRKVVLSLDNYECQLCKAKGKYRRAVVVHHVKHLKDRPDLALSIYYGEVRQLVSVCKWCHEDLHPERTVQYRYEKKAEAVTEERWD